MLRWNAVFFLVNFFYLTSTLVGWMLNRRICIAMKWFLQEARPRLINNNYAFHQHFISTWHPWCVVRTLYLYYNNTLKCFVYEINRFDRPVACPECVERSEPDWDCDLHQRHCPLRQHAWPSTLWPTTPTQGSTGEYCHHTPRQTFHCCSPFPPSYLFTNCFLQTWSTVALQQNTGLAIERARIRIPFATISKHGHFRSLHDAPVHSAV